MKEADRDKKKVCRFNIDTLGKVCQQQKDYGYDEGQPCILLKLNKVRRQINVQYRIGGNVLCNFV